MNAERGIDMKPELEPPPFNLKTPLPETSQQTDFSLARNARFIIQKQNAISPHHSHRYHYHDGYELYYLYSGECYSFIKDRTYHVQKGNIILFNDYDIHRTTNFSKCGYERILINFKRDFLENFSNILAPMDLFQCFHQKMHLIRLTAQEQHYVESLLAVMIQESKNQDTGYDAYLQTAMIQLLIFLNRRSPQLQEEPKTYINTTHKTMLEITNYVNQHYFENITLTSISEHFYISPYYFSRTFKKVIGFTFIDYLNSVRIKEAQRLLKETDLHITKIADAVGYNNTTHFRRVFKEITGLAPLAYRKLEQKKNF